jgi:Caspase domain/Domain of unknown function (DUF4384)
MERRRFLQRFGSILAVLGLTEADWLSLGNRYYYALAESNPRKLGLLVGINQYPQNSGLGGCLTDVELQKELLIHRFGFNSSDILTLTDEQASREFIETAFYDHLIKPSKAGDAAFFHFSGYGSRVNSGIWQNALLPVDGVNTQDSKIVNYLLEDTLLSMMRSLPTERVIAVLDTSYYTPSISKPSGLRIRSRQTPAKAQLRSAEVDQQYGATSPSGTNGIVITATSDPNQVAAELVFSGFIAGLFTYTLTQYLWEITPPSTIQVSLSSISNYTRQLGSKQQATLLNPQKNQLTRTVITDNFLSDSFTGAEGVLTEIEEDGKTVYLWLGGIPPQVLEYYGVNSRFIPVSDGKSTVQLVVRSRTGLTVKAQPLDNDSRGKVTSLLKVGQLVQEAVRVLTRNIGLVVALDTGLERIERVDAISAFSSIPRVSSVVAGEQPADYVFGKLQQTPSGYGLFSLGSELVGNTAGESGEAAKVAVQRLGTILPTLLAAKLWRLTDNEGSSRLAVKGSLEIINAISSRVIMQKETLRILGAENSGKKLMAGDSASTTPRVPIGSRMQYRLQNQSDRPIYLMLVGFNSSGRAIGLYPWQNSLGINTSASKPPFKNVIISPGETLIVPQSISTAEWMIPGPTAEWEHHVIFSTAPFVQTLIALEAAKSPTTEQQPVGTLLNPLEVAQALLQDLHNASAEKTENQIAATDSYVLNVNNWASFSFIFQAV